MKLGWSITVSVDEYHKLLHEGKITFGDEGAIYVRQAQDPKTNQFWGVIGFNFGVKDLPSRSLMMQWLDAIYDNDPEKYDTLAEQIRQHQYGKLTLQKISDEQTPTES